VTDRTKTAFMLYAAESQSNKKFYYLEAIKNISIFDGIKKHSSR